MQNKIIDIKKLQKKKVEEYSNEVFENPVVSVCIQTYRHVNYIKQCLEGILMQKTDFDFEILLGEDESTDGTRKICIEFADKFPNRIRLFLHSRENVISIGGKATGRFNMLYNLYNAKGKYIAFCEGDDYWTDKHKLQKQVDFLETNPDFAICHHIMQVKYENNPNIKEFSNINQKEITTIHDLAEGNYIYTASCIFKKQDFELPNWFKESPIGDYPLHLLNSRYGKIKFINEVMGVYRIHDKGIWGSQSHEYISINSLKVKELLFKNFDNKTEKILRNQYRKIAMHLIITYLNLNNISDAKKYLNKAKKYASKFKIFAASLYYLLKLFIKFVKILN